MNEASKNKSNQLVLYERVKGRMPELTGILGGMWIGVVGQPFSNWKKASQHAVKGTTKRAIYDNIVAPRVIRDVITGRSISYGGGWRNFFTALPWGILGSTVKQGTKGTALVAVDNMPLPFYLKAVISAGIITSVITPFDRISNALVSKDNKHLSKTEVLKTVFRGGMPSWYKGAGVNVVKDFSESLLIYSIRFLKVEYLKSSETELSAREGAVMAFLTTVCKLAVTQPLDGIKADLQQGLKHGERVTVLDVVRRQGLYKLFTAGLGARFILNYLSFGVSFLAMHLNDILKAEKRLEVQE